MLNFDETEEIKMEQEAYEITMAERAKAERDGQIIAVTAAEYAKAAQHRSLLLTLRSTVKNDSYNVDKVAAAVIAAFDELEGAGC